ncbi:MAG: extracellular solute-binding protein [Gammaproteobacteria bacterium]|nr:extracellular solute-binding protein [Gammaproteobacteria bacterium]
MSKNRPTRASTTRREFLKQSGAAGALLTGFPYIARAAGKNRQLVIGCAGGHTGWMAETVVPVFERKYDCTLLLEGTKSTVNLEKMRANKDAPYLSVVMMDDPVLILAADEGLITPLTPQITPNIAAIKPAAVHRDGMWANYQQPWCGIAYNTDKMSDGVQSWSALWDEKNKGKVIIPSLQNTEGMWAFFLAAHLATGKPLAEAQYEVDAAFDKMAQMKPNLLTIYTKMPPSFNLLEQGEAWLLAGGFSSFAIPRKLDGAPVDLAAPSEAICAMPSGIALVKDGPEQELALAFVNEMLGAEFQALMTPKTFSIPTNTATPTPAGLPDGVPVFSPDWQFVSENRRAWIERWDRLMAI